MAKDDKKQEDTAANVLFREIDEEVRQDKLTELWKKYGTALIASIVIVVGVFAAYEGWKAYDLAERKESGDIYAQALDQARNNNLDGALATLQALESQADGGYNVLSRLQQAALLARQGQTQEAVDSYFLIAQNGELDEVYRDLATVLGAMNGLDSLASDDLIQRLSPIANGAGALRHSAQELLAFAHAKKGETAKASELLSALSEDASAPPALRQRADEFSQAFAS